MPQPFESALIAAGIQGIEGQDWRTTKTNISVGALCGRLKRRPNKGNHEWLRLRRSLIPLREIAGTCPVLQYVDESKSTPAPARRTINYRPALRPLQNPTCPTMNRVVRSMYR